MDLQDIKRRIFKGENGWNNYINVSIEEMDWLVEQAELIQSHAPEGRNYTNAQYVHLLQEKEKLEEERAYWKMKYRDSVTLDEEQE